MTQNQKMNIGIDLGTTYTTICRWNQNNQIPEVLRDDMGSEIVASWISLSQMDTSGMLVGNNAKKDDYCGCVVYDAKRILGREFTQIPEINRKFWPFEVRNDKNPYILVRNPLNTVSYERFEPEEISGIILRYMLNIFKMRSANCEIGKVVVTVPADFSHKQRKATETACRLAGIENVILMNEPSAAVLEYKRVTGNNVPVGSKILVIDFGGGTLDINCCEMKQNGEIKVVLNGGDQNLGGNDFDQAMINVIKRELYENALIEENHYDKIEDATPLERKQQRTRLVKLKKEAERAKIQLSKTKTCELSMEDLFSLEGDKSMDEDIFDAEISVHRRQFEEECESKGLYKRAIDVISDVMKRAQFTKDNIDIVLFVGGTCLIPSVRQKLKSLFTERSTIIEDDTNYNPLTVVAQGACFHSFNNANKQKDRYISETIPKTIGLETNGGKFMPLCLAGDRLPISKNVIVKTSSPNQTSIRFNIYRGDSEYVQSPDMQFIASFAINDIPESNEPISFNVCLYIQEDGICIVEAHSIGTKNRLSDSTVCEMDLRPIDEHFEQIKEHFKNFLPSQLTPK